jgi:hypothetical protein
MTTPRHHRLDVSRTILWASAFVIAALVIVQAGRLPANQAYAETVSTKSGYTLLTADSGRGAEENPDEILCVIDNAAEVMLVYEVDARSRTIVVRDGGPLAPYFRNVINR